jgi:hypothetical protein
MANRKSIRRTRQSDRVRGMNHRRTGAGNATSRRPPGSKRPAQSSRSNMQREKVFVDLCDGLSLFDPNSGERIKTQLFVGALGASSYTFAIATLSQELPVWLDCHVRMFITGLSGSGKSFVAQALGQHACRNGFSVQFQRQGRKTDRISQAGQIGKPAALARGIGLTVPLIRGDNLRERGHIAPYGGEDCAWYGTNPSKDETDRARRCQLLIYGDRGAESTHPALVFGRIYQRTSRIEPQDGRGLRRIA